MIYRPVRERSMDTIMDLTDRCLQNTGYEDVSLLSLSTGDYTAISPLINTLMPQIFSPSIYLFPFPPSGPGHLDQNSCRRFKRFARQGLP